jgi:toxin ParE1/3/4
MPRSIRHSVEARADLKRLRSYLEELGAEAAADRLLHEIADILVKLSEVPEMGPGRPELAAHLRSFTVGKYVLFYTYNARNVRLERVIHSARDITPKLFT